MTYEKQGNLYETDSEDYNGNPNWIFVRG